MPVATRPTLDPTQPASQTRAANALRRPKAKKPTLPQPSNLMRRLAGGMTYRQRQVEKKRAAGQAIRRETPGERPSLAAGAGAGMRSPLGPRPTAAPPAQEPTVADEGRAAKDYQKDTQRRKEKISKDQKAMGQEGEPGTEGKKKEEGGKKLGFIQTKLVFWGNKMWAGFAELCTSILVIITLTFWKALSMIMRWFPRLPFYPEMKPGEDTPPKPSRYLMSDAILLAAYLTVIMIIWANMCVFLSVIVLPVAVWEAIKEWLADIVKAVAKFFGF